MFLEELSEEDERFLEKLISSHNQMTGSTLAEEILSDWMRNKKKFVKVMPKDYKRVLEVIKAAQSTGMAEENAIMEAMND